MIVNTLTGFFGGGSSAIISVQKVSITLSGVSSNTASITTVNPDFTSIIYGGLTTTDTSGTSDNFAVLTLTNGNTVTADRAIATGGITTVHCTVVEWNPAVIESVHQGVVNLTSVSTNTATIANVVTANSVCLFNGNNRTANSTSNVVWNTSVELTDSTTVTARRGSTSGTVNIGYCVIEFKGGVLTSNQKVSVAGTDGATATLTAVDMAKAITFFGGFYHSSGGGTVTLYIPRFELTDSTTVTLNRGSTSTSTPVVGKLNVVEFNPSFLKSVQRGTISYSTASATATITVVDTDKSFVTYLGCTESANVTSADYYQKLELTDSTTVTSTVGLSGVNYVTSWEVPEFK